MLGAQCGCEEYACRYGEQLHTHAAMPRPPLLKGSTLIAVQVDLQEGRRQSSGSGAKMGKKKHVAW